MKKLLLSFLLSVAPCGIHAATNEAVTITATTGAVLNTGNVKFGPGKLWLNGTTLETLFQPLNANLTTWAAKTPYAGSLSITTSKTVNVTNSLTLAGTDSSTLNIGTGGTLGTAAFVAVDSLITKAPTLQIIGTAENSPPIIRYETSDGVGKFSIFGQSPIDVNNPNSWSATIWGNNVTSNGTGNDYAIIDSTKGGSFLTQENNYNYNNQGNLGTNVCEFYWTNYGVGGGSRRGIFVIGDQTNTDRGGVALTYRTNIDIAANSLDGSFSNSFHDPFNVNYQRNGGVVTSTVNNTANPAEPITASTGSQLLSLASADARTTHGLSAGNVVQFTTTGTLPAPLVSATDYYVIASGLAARDFRVSTTYGGAAVTLTTVGSGTNTVTGTSPLASCSINLSVGLGGYKNTAGIQFGPGLRLASYVNGLNYVPMISNSTGTVLGAPNTSYSASERFEIYGSAKFTGNADVYPNSNGTKLGKSAQRWSVLATDINVTGDIFAGPTPLGAPATAKIYMAGPAGAGGGAALVAYRTTCADNNVNYGSFLRTDYASGPRAFFGLRSNTDVDYLSIQKNDTDALSNVSITNASLNVATAGRTLSIKSGTNALAGTVTLASGTGTIASTAIDANTVLVFTLKTLSGTQSGNAYVSAITAGTGCTITGGVADNSTYNWVALKVN